MLQLLFRAAAVAAVSALCVVQAQAATVVVSLKGVSGTAGTMRGVLCDKDSYKKACAHKASISAASGEQKLVFEGVAPGKWAFKGFHDQNDNKKLDTNFIGWPTEGYALSRDAKPTTGLPAFDDVSFDVKDGSNEIAVTMRY